MSIENFPNKALRFDQLLKNRESEGWQFAGRERLTQTKFSKEAKFEEIQFQTEEDIKKRYLNRAKQEDPSSDFEVDLILDEHIDKLTKLREMSTDEEYQQIINNLAPQDRNYLVFVRRMRK
jgi:DNA-binding MurR/RpiR family transcriptional regulator